ncbi:hypothetical protein HPP92_003355 [Vanilla planifolia]|uniref:RING-CH-type domain-containing protein n=1 Tax=Vanilla planifolia TaxID=51239 RepID=A0A835SGH9_VANPL|nr:hypothetical protein HPP92_003355 [Vanilla planifolia]
MGEHLALLVDRLLTESTLTATIESRRKAETGNGLMLPLAPGSDFISEKKDVLNGASAGNLVECRICQDEEEDGHMEVPCSCRGSLKFAHRKCIQRWCNEKGDTTCEICQEQFKPGYTAPPQLFHYGSIPMNFRGSWEVSRREVHDSQIITMVPSDRTFNSDHDYYSTASTRSIIYCRFVAIIFMVLLILRHTLPIMIRVSQHNDQDSFALFTMLVFGSIGVILPVMVMIRVISMFQHRRQHQGGHVIPVSEGTPRSPNHLFQFQ